MAADVSLDAATESSLRTFTCSGSGGDFTARVMPLPDESGVIVIHGPDVYREFVLLRKDPASGHWGNAFELPSGALHDAALALFRR